MDGGLKELEVKDFLGVEARMICTASGCSRTHQRCIMEDWRAKQSASTCTLSLLQINTGLEQLFGYLPHVQY